MSGLKKSFKIRHRDFIHAGEASITLQTMLKKMNIEPAIIRRIAVCGYEGEMNVVMHGGDGALRVEIDTNKIILEISDNGPGIPDISKAMVKGFSTASDEDREMGFGAGMGLPNMDQNSDEMTINSEKGNGTCVKMFFVLDIQED